MWGGFQHYRSTQFLYYRGVSGVVVVFDKSDRESFNSLEKWAEEIKICASEETVFIIVGNKCDLQAEISLDEAQKKAFKHQALYVDTSAKTGEQIDNILNS